MKKIFAIASATVLGLGAAACDSPAENAVENQAEAYDERVEDQADALEDAGAVTDAQADAMKDQGEATKDAIEDRADATDPQGPASAAPVATPTTTP